MAAMLQTRRLGPGFTQTLGWWVVLGGQGDDGIVTHGGETPGYTCTVAYDPKTRVGVVVLSNSAENDGGLAWHLLRPNFPMATSAAEKARRNHKETAIDPQLLERYIGQYQPPAGGNVTIERQGDALVLKSESAPQGLRLHAESEQKFFILETDLQVTFQVEGRSRATNLVIHFAGIDTLAPRIESQPEKQ